jgi:tetratricopeptide (TPR) repeat protein
MIILKKYLIVVLLFIIAQPLFSCINEYRAHLDGSVEFSDAGVYAVPYPKYNLDDKANLLTKLNEADTLYKRTKRLEDYSDFAALLVYDGQYERAKQIFIYIESKKPGLYNTAANLGTTYELLGMNDSAYYWIKKAMRINPNSHGGSEWIHLKILEAKIKAKGDEKYLWAHSILSLDFGRNEKPENINKLDLEKLREQIHIQLEERMSFIKPKDPVVAQLLFDLGNLSAMTLDVKSGLEIFAVAERYGYASDLLNKRKAHFLRLQSRAEVWEKTKDTVKHNPKLTLAIVAVIFVGSVFVVAFFIRRRIRRRKSELG